MTAPTASKGMTERAIRQSAAYGTATILSRATMVVSLLVLPFLLSPSDYGALSMIVTVTALVAIMVPLEVTQGLARYYAPAPPSEKKAYASSAWTFLLATALVFLLLGESFARPLARLILGDPSYLTAFRIALPFMALSFVFSFLQSQCRWEFRTVEYVLISLVFSFLTLALSLALGALLERALVGVIVGQVIGAIFAVGLGLFGLRRSFSIGIDRDKLAELLRFSLPLVPASVALFVSVYASRVILNGMTSLADVGVYTLASQIAGIASLGIVGVQSALTPLIMAHHHEPQTPGQIARIFEAVVGVAVLACLALGLFAPEFIRYVGNPAYERAGPLVLILAPGLLLTQMYVFAPGFAVAKRTHLQMWISIVSALVAVGANFWLIHQWGIIGAAIATLLAGAVFILLWFVASQRLYRVPVRWSAVAVAVGGGIALGAAGALVPHAQVIVGLAFKAAAFALAAALVFASGLVPFRGGFAAVRSLIMPLRPRTSPGRG